MSAEVVRLARAVLDGLSSEGYAIEQLEDDARALAQAVIDESEGTTA